VDWLSVAVGNIHGAVGEATRNQKKVQAEAKVAGALLPQIQPASIGWRHGVFGRLQGSARELRASVPLARND
jgi:hypothetical protein